VSDGTASVFDHRPHADDWWTDGSLALDPHELWEEREPRRRLRVVGGPELQDAAAFITVPRVPPSRPPNRALRARREQQRADRRARRFAALTIVSIVAAVTLALTAFSGGHPAVVQPAPAAPRQLPPNGTPAPLVVAVHGALRLQLPIQQSRVTAIGYSDAADGAVTLDPLGRQGNEGALARLKRKIFGGSHGDLVYYRLSSGETSQLHVGGAPDTDVYSPVDGTVVAVTPYVINLRQHGVRIDIQPTATPSLVVSLTRLRADPALSVGYAVAAGTTKIGTVLDLSKVERQTLARYTQDAGNHVTVEVHPAASLTLP
jgi:hypothetical protein